MRNWGIEESNLLEKYYKSGLNYVEIAKRLFRSADAIRMMLRGKDYYVAGRKKELHKFDMILNEVSRFSKIKGDTILLKTRKREVVQLRQLCHYLSKEFTTASTYKIGEYFGLKDHATVLHSIKTIQNLLDTDEEFKSNYKIIHMRIINRLMHEESKSPIKKKQKEQLILIKNSLNDIHLKITFNEYIKSIKNGMEINS